ncbi:MAG: hypothetical protein HYR62_09200 [Actinobacteria bacterium]|nr:hypothetical protein [Actinomycetota bacterium]MBI3688058.1 hypothetical protein [Actinomycetota bacterium]
MTSVLHEDDPVGEYLTADGRVVRNLSAEEYEETYSNGTPCQTIPDEVLLRALADADQWREDHP